MVDVSSGSSQWGESVERKGERPLSSMENNYERLYNGLVARQERIIAAEGMLERLNKLSRELSENYSNSAKLQIHVSSLAEKLLFVDSLGAYKLKEIIINEIHISPKLKKLATIGTSGNYRLLSIFERLLRTHNDRIADKQPGIDPNILRMCEHFKDIAMYSDSQYSTEDDRKEFFFEGKRGETKLSLSSYEGLTVRIDTEGSSSVDIRLTALRYHSDDRDKMNYEKPHKFDININGESMEGMSGGFMAAGVDVLFKRLDDELGIIEGMYGKFYEPMKGLNSIYNFQSKTE